MTNVIDMTGMTGMTGMTKKLIIRSAKKSDKSFILGLSPTLAQVAELTWHTDSVVQKMQDDYIIQMLNQSSQPSITLIAENNELPLGFIHACAHEDEISGEVCGTVPLLAVSSEAQGFGVGQLLMKAAQDWAKNQGYRLLHLEVFANNNKAQNFYQNLGFKGETLHMIKEL